MSGETNISPYPSLLIGIINDNSPATGNTHYVATDKNGALIVSPPTQFGNTVTIENPNSDTIPTTDNAMDVLSFTYGYNTSGSWERQRSQANNVDGIAAIANGSFAKNAFIFGWNGATFDRVRVANIFHTVSATALGNTAVWTPTAGKKFRLMGYTIDVAGTLAATGTQVLQLRDGAATVIKNHVANMIQTQTANISGGDSHMGCDLGQGQLSAAANNVLNINLGTAMGSGAVTVNVWGTEE